jgi:hypothetical protein
MAGLGMAIVCVCASYTISGGISGLERFTIMVQPVPPSDSRQVSYTSFPPVLELTTGVDGDAYGYYIFNRWVSFTTSPTDLTEQQGRSVKPNIRLIISVVYLYAIPLFA